MFMPTFAVVQELQSRDDPSVDEHQLIGDLFYSGDKDSLRLLAELQIDRHAWDMERLQAGWRFSPEVTLWFGRYHNPIGYWNTEHHHGHYMETTAERPRIVEFEDEGGVLPIHLAGFELQGLQPMGDASLQYDLGVASGPRVIGGELEPVDVIREPRWNKLAVVGRAAWRPDAALDSQYGVFAARTRIPVDTPEFKLIEQDLAGVYFLQDIDRLRLVAEIFDIHHRLVDGGGLNWPSYWAGYAQAEYQIVPAVWTAFARHEAISNRLDTEYLDLFPELPRQREIVGVRWDFYQNQALKLEGIRDKSFNDTTFDGIELQWSALFP